MEVVQHLLETQPILSAFLAIGLGFLVGQINIMGFSLGVGGVLFVGLAIGAFAPKAQIAGPIGLVGLVMFLYGIGILYGRQFFEGMTSAAGRRYNLLALIGCIAALLVTMALGRMFSIDKGLSLGIYAGSMTSTPTLQAALEILGNKQPSVGYSIAYPFGVIGPILCIYFMTQRVKPKFMPKAQRFHMAEISLGEAAKGRKLGDLLADFPPGMQATMVRKQGHNIVADDAVALEPGDGLLVIAEREGDIQAAASKFGALAPGRIVRDRADLDYIRVFVEGGRRRGSPREAAAAVGLSDPSFARPAL